MAEVTTNPAWLTPYRPVGDHLFPLNYWATLNRDGQPLGKTPAEKGWKSKTYGFDHCVEWMTEGKNVGFRLGDGWGVLDYDPRNDDEKDALDRFCDDFGIDLARCFTVTTGGGGKHVYLKIPPLFHGREQIPEYPGVEFKHSKRRYVVAPGSIHPTGIPYTPRDGSVAISDTLEAPEALLDAYKHAAPPDDQRGSGVEGFGAFTSEQLASSLARIPVEAYRNHEEWLQLMMACHWMTGGEGREEFVDWSTSDPEYSNQADIIWARWDSLTPKADGIKAGLFFKALEKAGVSKSEWPSERASVLFDADDCITAEEFESTTAGPVEKLPPGVRKVGQFTYYTPEARRAELGAEPQGLDGFFNGRPGQIYVAYGPAGDGKTQAMVALAEAVASGAKEFLGRPLHIQGKSIFFAMDDEEGFLKSDLAFLTETGRGRNIEAFFDDPRFEDEDSWADHTEACTGSALVFIDTLATALPTNDPDKSNFVSQFYARLKEFGRKTGAVIILIHHTPKDKPTVARNSGSIIANASGSFCIHRPDGDDGTYSEMRGMKVRGERAPPIYFGVESIAIDYEGKPRTGGFVKLVDPESEGRDRSKASIAEFVVGWGNRESDGVYSMPLNRFRKMRQRRTSDEAVIKNWDGKPFVGSDFELDYQITPQRNKPNLLMVRCQPNNEWLQERLQNDDDDRQRSFAGAELDIGELDTAQEELRKLATKEGFSGLI